MSDTNTNAEPYFLTYRVSVGDLEYPGEFVGELHARAFANGARFVLDNSAPRNATYYESPKVTLTTYRNSYDYDSNIDVVTAIGTREL